MTKIQLSDFEISDDGKEVLSCIQGHRPLSCTVSENKKKRKKKVRAIFPKDACSVCEFQSICPVKRIKGGNYRLEYKLEAMATSKRKAGQEGKDFKERYKIRSGIEATVSEADRVTGLKNVWCRGLDRVRTAVTFKALALNIKRYIASELEKAAKAKAGGARGLHIGFSAVLARIRGFFRGRPLAHAA